MKIAILSDIHDNRWNLAVALRYVHDTDVLICCGDLCSPFILDQLATGFVRPVHVVFGNNDGDLYRITQKADRYNQQEGNDRIFLHGHFYQGELGGKRIAVNHYPDIAKAVAESGSYDLVCYGHDHSYYVDPPGQQRKINPGTLMGYNPVSGADVPATFVVYDTQTDQATGYQIDIGGIGGNAGVFPYNPSNP